MFILDDDKLMKKTFLTSVGFGIFFGIFTLIYYRFSHNVYSDYMTYLALIPLVLGAIPALIGMVRGANHPGYFTYHLYFSGVAAVTLSSCLRGIFEIAGNSSALQMYLMLFGVTLMGAGVLLFFASKVTGKRI